MRKTEKSRETKSGEAERPPIPQPKSYIELGERIGKNIPSESPSPFKERMNESQSESAKPDIIFYKCGHAIAQKQFKAGESIRIFLFSSEDESPELCPTCKSRKTIPDDKHSFRKKDIINKLFR